ncbi:UNVERIFIED_CONTAM: hypothetical protein FKN15_005134 [Acipenser sinensis]
MTRTPQLPEKPDSRVKYSPQGLGSNNTICQGKLRPYENCWQSGMDAQHLKLKIVMEQLGCNNNDYSEHQQNKPANQDPSTLGAA